MIYWLTHYGQPLFFNVWMLEYDQISGKYVPKLNDVSSVFAYDRYVRITCSQRDILKSRMLNSVNGATTVPGKIMIVANDLNTVYLLQRYAEKSGFQAIRIGADAPIIQMVQKVRPALVILDDEVWPDAPKVLQELAENSQTCEIPVLCYSHLSKLRRTPGFTGSQSNTVRYDDFLAFLQSMGVRP